MGNAKKDRSWTLRIRLGALIGIVASSVLLIPTLIEGRPGQAPQTGPTYKVLHTFTGGTDGSYPLAPVMFDPTHKLLVGTTTYGGVYGYGVVFGVNLTGKETVLYSFTGGADGSTPVASVILDPTRKLIVGTTEGGGSYGYGTVFGVSPTTGKEAVLYTFTGGADGGWPAAGLIRDAAGNLYGTTSAGGTYGWGVVFELSPTGQETVLYSFTWGADGVLPEAGLILDAAGNLYGTTYYGGNVGCGVVFELSPAGQETVLYSFTGGADGRQPAAGLIRDAAGNLYGTAEAGGAYEYGTVFELSPTGQETVLYSFTGGADGGKPLAGLVRDATGNLYGTASAGGDMSGCGGQGCGVVFKLTP